MSEKNPEIIGLRDIKIITYDGMYYATGYAPRAGRVTQCGRTKPAAIRNLYEYVYSGGNQQWTFQKK